MKVVLDGGGSTGKTTLINEFKKSGYPVVEEAARIILREQPDLVKKDFLKFQLAIFHKQLELEKNVKGTVFLDRGLPSGLAYFRFRGLPVPPEIMKTMKTHRYDKVFVLEPVGEFQQDGVRWETPEERERLHKLIIESYKSLGYNIIKVPPLSVRERVLFIKKALNLQ